VAVRRDCANQSSGKRQVLSISKEDAWWWPGRSGQIIVSKDSGDESLGELESVRTGVLSGVVMLVKESQERLAGET
jgi:hypothetical protein